ncbi:MAG: helix-turn-helix domain-containing protein [Bacteroidota bacterium]
MQVTLTPGAIILFSLLAQGAFAALILLFKAENKRANRYMALLILLLSCWLCDAFFRVGGIYEQRPDLYFLPIYLSLGFGPLIYHYTKALTRGDFIFRPQDTLHFIPVLLQFAAYVFLQSQDYGFRRDFWFEVHRPYTFDLELILSFVSLLLYLLAGRRLLLRYKDRIDNNFSSVARITLSWLRSLHLLLGSLVLLWLLESCVRLFWGIYPHTPYSTISVGLTMLLMASGSILQKDLSEVTDNLADPPDEQQTVSAQVVELVRAVMTEQELFLRQELTLKEFAVAAGLPAREVSRAINQGLGMSFLDFVNQARVRRFRELVVDKDFSHLSLLGLALESGFNSKSTFNRVFKKLEGCSPSEYRNKAQNAS